MAQRLLVFDTRRGNAEGQEDDKVLACYPPTMPLVQQSGMAGLLQGLLLFTATFAAAPASAAAPLRSIDESNAVKASTPPALAQRGSHQQTGRT